MNSLSITFWVLAALLFYSYFGYGMLVYFLLGIRSLFRVKKPPAVPELPAITLVVAAYNEAAVIEDKIRNSIQLDYPAGLLHFLFITDGSDDGTDELVRQYPQIQLLHQPGRRGKVAAINRAMQEVKTPIVVFSDANAMINAGALKALVRHYADPRTGGVAGEKKVGFLRGADAAALGESAYWKYESWLKGIDARLYSAVGAAGELYSIRTELFQPVPEAMILDDLIISLRVNRKGYRLAYEPGAYALEAPSATMLDEEKRKARIGAGAFQLMWGMPALVHLIRNPILAFQYLSRRVLRWLCPFLLILLFIINGWLHRESGQTIFTLSIYAQVFFYLLAAIGGVLSGLRSGFVIFYLPFYFVFLNYCVLLGFLRFIRGGQSVLWEKARRGG